MRFPILPSSALALAFAISVAGSADSQIRTRTTSIALPDGAQVRCFSVHGISISTTRCHSQPARSRVAGFGSLVDVNIAPELEAAWKTAYRYIKRARTRKGWRSRVKGPLGELYIDGRSVTLGDTIVGRADYEVEAAIWELTCLQLGLTPADIEAGTTIVRRLPPS